MHGPLMCVDVSLPETMSGKAKDLQVFMFEQSIIFSEAFGKKTQFTSPSYNYKTHIQVNIYFQLQAYVYIFLYFSSYCIEY